MASSLPERILLATDGSEDAALAARAAADLARKSGAELHVVHVWHDTSTHASSYIERELKARAQEILDEQVAAAQKLGAAAAESHLVEGRTAEAILWLSERIEAGMIVLGSRGLGRLKRLLLGSVADGVVRHAHCPVLVIRGGDDAWPPGRAVIADDGSEASRSAGELAGGICSLFGAEATVVRAYPELPAVDEEDRQSDARIADDESRRQQHLLEERARELEDRLGNRPRTRIAVGDAAEVIVDVGYEDEPEQRRTLIAVGSRSLGLAERLRLGSVLPGYLAPPQGRFWSIQPRSRQRCALRTKPGLQ